MTGNEKIVRITSYALFAVLTTIIMIQGEQILKPIAWAAIFSFIVLPVCRKMEARRFPRALASLFGTLLFIGATALIMVFLVYESVHILKIENVGQGVSIDDIKMYIDSAQQAIGFEFFDSSEILVPDALKQILGLVAGKISGLTGEVVILTLIPMYLFFILNYRGLVWRFIHTYYKGEDLDRVSLSFQRSYASIYNYLSGTGILTIVTLVMTYLILLVFGIRYSFFFAVFLAVVNLIPYIGNLAGFVVILLFVWATSSPVFVLYVGVTLYVSNLVQENFLRPLLVGNKMEMNAAIVFTAVIVGGMIWGFAGMVLFIPLVGIAKAFIDGNPEWKSFGVFFESK
ncbi:MAG: AI-2E family transporter [Cyclobacteriaceae bacterium]|nr:AI-2E family transporter [Cyclobacteriaceae bacterium]MDH4296940.1 AI-2E family transporter [Cyclobacteriaceae bacterium]MDH5250806.1 AI-2E family transporter [Cyclobacteriaceae bacterium]